MSFFLSKSIKRVFGTVRPQDVHNILNNSLGPAVRFLVDKRQHSFPLPSIWAYGSSLTYICACISKSHSPYPQIPLPLPSLLASRIPYSCTMLCPRLSYSSTPGAKDLPLHLPSVTVSRSPLFSPTVLPVPPLTQKQEIHIVSFPPV